MAARAHRRLARVAALMFAILATALTAGVAAADDGIDLQARVLLQGHTRIGSWVAVEVDVANGGPGVAGELRISSTSQGRTRYSTIADLPTGSHKRFFLYAQPPAFRQDLQVTLVEGDRTIASRKIEFTLHDATQLLVGVVAEKPQGIVGGIDLPAGPNSLAPAVVTLTPADLPERVEAWSALDRLVWQDVDTSSLTDLQLDALRGWLAAGGRLVVVGGTAGPSVLSGLPDEILPYRPTATVDAPKETLIGLLGELPSDAADVIALGGPLARGRALASAGDAVTAADAPYGSGSVTIVGFDPGTRWIAQSKASDSLWQRLLPPRATTASASGDDSQLVSAVANLPSLALPPIGGLVAILLGYILLIGPVNYLVLRRLDRREWAWLTMPALIVVFAAGSYGFGAALRGSDVIVNEIAIVNGAPDATEGMAQVYLGVFSPSRTTYQLSVPGGALLSAPTNGEIVGGQAGNALDVIQGDPARVRNLSVGFGSLRTVRADTPAVVPRIKAELSLVENRVVGTIRNSSDQALEKPAVVLGRNVVVLPDLAPGAERHVELKLENQAFGQSLSDRILGQVFFVDPSQSSDLTQNLAIRHGILDHLTSDPMFGNLGTLPTDGPVLLAWGRKEVLPVRIEGQEPRRTGNVLYYIPLGLRLGGPTTFRSDLMRASIVDANAGFFNKGPFDLGFGQGTLTVAYRPMVFDGTIEPTRLLVQMAFGGDVPAGGVPVPVQPKPMASDDSGAADCAQLPCPDTGAGPAPAPGDGLPDVEIFDRTGAGEWKSLGHLEIGRTYDVADAARYVDPASGTVVVRFRNDRQDPVGFQFNVQLEGTVK